MPGIRLWPRPATGWGKAFVWSLVVIAGTLLLLVAVGQISAAAGCSASEVGRCAHRSGSAWVGIADAAAIVGFASFFLAVPVAGALAAIAGAVCLIRRQW